MTANKLEKAYQLIDEYNSKDPHTEEVNGVATPKELVYGQRMTERMDRYEPGASEHLRLAARAQHIGRWEIPRDSYAMDRKGYLQWRSFEKFHHARVVEPILQEAGYEPTTIEKVKFLLLKKELGSNAETQTLEDVVCLVFIQHYLEEFASHHDDDKVADILRKTMKKMSPRCIREASNLKVSERIQGLLLKAVGGN
jgi:hypothetical protein